MNQWLWTEPPELTTGVTNLLIVGICVVCAVRVSGKKQPNPLRNLFWLLFFLIMIPTGVFGFFVHAFVMDPETNRVAWIFLSILLGLTTTTLAISLFYEIFGRSYIKPILFITAAAEIVFAVTVCFLSGIVPRIHLVFVVFTGAVLFVIFVFLLRYGTLRPHFRWYIIAILTAVIGGLFEVGGGFTVSLLWKFDQGSVCHLFLAASMCFFAAGCMQGEYDPVAPERTGRTRRPS